MDPGDGGLPGGLRLDKVELGDRVTAHYAGAGGRLTVEALPPAQAGPDAAWRGDRLALVVRSATVADAQRDAAVEALSRMLQQRESAWGWLKQSPEQGPAGDAERQRLAELLERAERLAALGQHAAATQALEQLRATPPGDLPSLLRLARLSHRVPIAPELRGALTEPAVQTAARGQASLSEEGEALDRLRLALGSALALAGKPEEARRLVGPIVKAGRVPCDAWRVAADLGLAGAVDHGRAVADLVVRAEPRCDAAHAVRVRLARQAGDLAAARLAGGEALAARPDAALARSAMVPVAMADGDPGQAITYARVGLREQPTDADALAAVTALVGGGALDPITADRWKGSMRRHVAQGPLQLQGLVACLALEEPACALDAARQARAAVGDQPLLAALEAIAHARAGQLPEAKTALALAWARTPFATATLVAEAEVAMAEGDAAHARQAWSAYVAAAERPEAVVGPVSLADARVLASGGARPGPKADPPLSAQVAPEPAQLPPAPSDAAAREAQDKRWLVYGLAMFLTLALAIALAMRRRRKG